MNWSLWIDIPECQTLINTQKQCICICITLNSFVHMSKSIYWCPGLNLKWVIRKKNKHTISFEDVDCLPCHLHKWCLQGCFCQLLWRRWLELGSHTSCKPPLPASPRHYWCTVASVEQWHALYKRTIEVLRCYLRSICTQHSKTPKEGHIKPNLWVVGHRGFPTTTTWPGSTAVKVFCCC